MTPHLDAAARERILDFVRPLSVGIDGVTNFGFVERRLRISERFLEGERGAAGGLRADPNRLFLLAAFAGLPAARRITRDSREELLLRSVSLSFEEISSLCLSLSRLESSPESPEEKIVHDAILLESVGAYGVTQLLAAGARERMTLAEMAQEILEKMVSAHFVTRAGQCLAADRIAFATLFARKLAEEAEEFEAGQQTKMGALQRGEGK